MRKSRYGKNSSSGSLTSQISLRMLHSLLIQSFGRIRWAMILGELNLTRAYWLPVLSYLTSGHIPLVGVKVALTPVGYF